jgi:hypothetical protein
VEDRRLRLAIVLGRELIGTPRHLSQHPGGFVIRIVELDHHDVLGSGISDRPLAEPVNVATLVDVRFVMQCGLGKPSRKV